jgi:hypothetical protein
LVLGKRVLFYATFSDFGELSALSLSLGSV